MSVSSPPRPAYIVERIFVDEITIFSKESIAVHAATDPKRILCCFCAVVLLLLASCVFLVFSCRALAWYLEHHHSMLHLDLASRMVKCKKIDLNSASSGSSER